MDDVVEVLEREQQALEHLLFRLQHTRGVLVADDARFLGIAAHELESAAETVRELEASRATVVGLAGDATLRSLAEDSPEPYRSMFRDHRIALGRLAGEVGAMAESTQVLAADRLDELNGGGPGRFARGRRRRENVDELDRALVAASYASVLSASDSLRLPSLVSFLA